VRVFQEACVLAFVCHSRKFVTCVRTCRAEAKTSTLPLSKHFTVPERTLIGVATILVALRTRLRWTGRVVWIGVERNAHRVLVGKLEGKG
jgi:hypothetical protein